MRFRTPSIKHHSVISLTFYCDKVNESVTLIEYAKYSDECEGTCGILSCSHQETCFEEGIQGGGRVFSWSLCRACSKAAGLTSSPIGEPA